MFPLLPVCGILPPMDIAERTWWVLSTEGAEEGPIPEEEFQERLRAGKIPLGAKIKSNFMSDWEDLLKVITADESFRRPSTMPPPEPLGD